MKKILKFEDGAEVVVSPLSFEEFMALGRWVGASDMAYKAWLHKNNLVDPADYTEEALKTATFRLEPSDGLIGLVFNEALNDREEVWLPYEEFLISCSDPLKLLRDNYFWNPK